MAYKPSPSYSLFMEPSLSEIEPGFFIGNTESSCRIDTLRNNYIIALVSLSNARHGRWGVPKHRELVSPDHNLFIPCVDSSTQNLLVQMVNTCDFIDRMILSQVQSQSGSQQSQSQSQSQSQQNPDPYVELSTPTKTSGGVLVNSDRGVSRSSTIVIAYLMRKHQAKLIDVLPMVKAKRNIIRPRTNFMAQLKVWEEVGYQIWEDEEKKIPKAPYQAYTERRAAELKKRGLTGNEPIAPMSLGQDDPYFKRFNQ